MNNPTQPYLIVLGIAQDGGVPQAGDHRHPAWRDSALRRHAACLGIVDPVSGQRWMIEATPDFREQLHMLDEIATQRSEATGDVSGPLLSGIAITHAHIGHYTGLIHLGREVMNTRRLPLYVMPDMAAFLRFNAPWRGLVQQGNVRLVELDIYEPMQLNDRISLTPFPVPHRDEYSETVGFIIAGPERRAVFLPDIDSWWELDELGTGIETIIGGADTIYLDATFYDRNELPGRDMSAVPHPTITESMERFTALPEEERRKIRFIHLNHTNPALDPANAVQHLIRDNGYMVAEEKTIELL